MDISVSSPGINMHRLCRICLQEVKDSTNLFSIESQEISKNIFLCFQVTLRIDKHLPHLICSECLNELNRANSFRLKCISIDERLGLICKDVVEANTVDTKSIRDDKTPIIQESSTTDIDEGQNDYTESNDFNGPTDSMNCNESNTKSYIPSDFICDLCNKVLKTKISLLKHYVSMHEKRKHIGKVSGFGAARRYHCTSCPYSTPHSQTLVSHMRTHNGERPYSCECGKSFTQSSSLAAHRKTHSATTYFTCSLCGKQFKHAFTMKNHMRVHERASFSCNICFKALKSKETLQAHMYRHYKICNYNCEDCGDTFVTSAELLNHRKKHNTEKKIECHLCGYRTHTKKNLIIHLKRYVKSKSLLQYNMKQ